MLRRSLIPLGLALAVLAAWPAAALDRTATDRTPLDRTALAAAACGGAAGQGRAAEDVVRAGPHGTAADLAWAGGVLRALAERRLACTPSGAVILDAPGAGEGIETATGAPRPAGDGRAPVLGLRQRAGVEAALGTVDLLTGAPAEVRGAGLSMIEKRMAGLPAEALAGILDRAAGAEADPALRRAIEAAAQAASLSSADPARRLAAIGAVARSPSGATLSRLVALRADPAYADPAFRGALDAGIARVERGIAVGNVLAILYNALSFASILFMAAAGLAIIFGLMGVINLAQGEFIMLGAYAAWGVQEGLRRLAPGWIDLYLIAAIPVAFLVTALIGIALEALVLRHLYRRPLMSLLATWAVSLFLVSIVRVVFGTQNLQFLMPAYVSGGLPLYGDFIVTWNRLFAILFAAGTLALTLFTLRGTNLGLDIRAVTQNRDMAACLGIRTRRVDRLAFGFGSGLAGLAGVALCPIFSVNPGMGANFIIDSFMVVVLGGVGTVLGTLVAAIGIGGANVAIEPLYGAVAAKVIVLVGIILFIQRRPEGLFAARRRR